MNALTSLGGVQGFIDDVIATCEAAKVTLPIRELDGSNLTALGKVRQAIYVIEQVQGDPKDTFGDYKQYKATKARACAKLNAPSPIMYVGSSTTGVRKRIEQHLGIGHHNTYALHLKHWFKGEFKIVVLEYDTNPKVLQLIEDALSHTLAPAFGKRGLNNTQL